MPSLTVTAKGQITLKRELLQHLGVSPGQVLEVSKLADGVLVIQQAKSPLGLKAFAGCLPPPTLALSVDEMNTLIADSWAGRR